ncbi:hypothetical protein CEXT_505611 [Caerostris extrusa]|uniref:Uncharacterized protein n=1 Tax=Caerostris extrusa TaxID=172846 RepID=A0AAV4XPM6_CAEEX|nr:hypothetical protein CEXT_505611 [Caerostris extrusa]
MVSHNGWRSALHQQGFLRASGHLRQRIRYLGRRKLGAFLQNVDVRRVPGDLALLPRGAHLPEEEPLQVEVRMNVLRGRTPSGWQRCGWTSTRSTTTTG